MDHLEKVWERVRGGRHTVVLGSLPADLPTSSGFYALRVSGDGAQRAMGPLLEARHRIEQLLGGPLPILDQAAERVWIGLRRRLLGEIPEAIPGSAIVESLNRLRRQSADRWVLIVDAVDAADEDSLHLLREMVTRPTWLQVPLILAFVKNPSDGPASALLAALTAIEGPDGLIQLEPPMTEARPTRDRLPEQLRSLPAPLIAVLRAGAIIGSGFEVSLVAALLGIDPLRVLDLLQEGADAGLPLEDEGDSRFNLPDALTQALRASTLPSLTVAWHRRLADLLSSQLPEVPSAVSAVSASSGPSTSSGDRERSFSDIFPSRQSGPSSVLATLPPVSINESLTRSRVPSDLRTTLPPPSARTGPSEWSSDPNARRTEGIGASIEARAATHLVAAGAIEDGAARFLVAAREAAAVGAHVQAVSYAREALSLIERLPASPRRRRLRITALCELGRLQWQAAGPNTSAASSKSAPGSTRFTLAAALESLRAARELLEDSDPAELRASVITLLSSVYFDLGDVRSLELALEELTKASRTMLAAGEAIGAARLLNDQAAIYVRLGDPVRASHLLEEAHRIFEKLRPTDAGAEIELAETNHLLARLPLHGTARPGREGDAIEMGLRHARAAEAAYRRLGASRELTRVWETIGRLGLRAGQLDQALSNLKAAHDAQRELSDVLGLARTTAAMAEVLFARGDHEGAARLLSESIALNLEKGSPIGLAYNHRSLDQLLRRLPATPLDATIEAFKETRSRLSAAEAVLGRIRLPSELN